MNGRRVPASLLLALLLLAAAAFSWYLAREAPQAPPPGPLPGEARIPVANPPLEPDRPDLFEEPRIEEPRDQDDPGR